MSQPHPKKLLRAAVQAARAAGQLMRKNLRATKHIDSEVQYDIKLALDVRCQKIIEKSLRACYPDISILGEEESTGDPDTPLRWVVDPIDGTVNFAYGIPHACTSIALQQRMPNPPRRRAGKSDPISPAPYRTLLGVVYDPFADELWTALRGGPARLNGRAVHVSTRDRLDRSIVSIGFAKGPESLARMLPVLNRLIPRVRKIRMMGAAALALTYVASGRFDGYVESGIRLWDIAAGGLILECAGGDFEHEALDNQHTYRLSATNGLIKRQLDRVRAG
ncbi:MAG TPA: inositol monophosphatase family protein [Methylomirabilota bacterium]|nr:inositol monophosphatase family protein [Methylomirabilota bacterium]